MFPDDVETITMTRQDYDRLMENLIYENVELKQRIDKTIEYIESKIQHRSYKVNDIVRKYDHLEMFDETIVELLDILKGSDKE